eukprot:scaffold5609_cov14-Tisochrysis_lutea.AAC.1
MATGHNIALCAHSALAFSAQCGSTCTANAYFMHKCILVAQMHMKCTVRQQMHSIADLSPAAPAHPESWTACPGSPPSTWYKAKNTALTLKCASECAALKTSP